MLAATITPLNPDGFSMEFVGVGVQDDGDRIVAARRFLSGISPGQPSSDDVGVIYRITPQGDVTETVMGTFAGHTYPSAVSPNGMYVTGVSNFEDARSYRGFRIEADNPSELIDVGGLGPVPESWTSDVNNDGTVVGTTNGLGVAFRSHPSTGIVALTEPVGAGANGISNDGAIVGHRTYRRTDNSSLLISAAAQWVDDELTLFELHRQYDSAAIDNSENGKFVVGNMWYEDLEFFETIVQPVIWTDGELHIIPGPDGELFNARAAAVTDNGYVVGNTFNNGYEGTAFIWHETFGNPRSFDEWLLTEHGVIPPEPTTEIYEAHFDGEMLHFAVNGSDSLISATPTNHPNSVTHPGTDGDDILRIDVTGLSSVVVSSGAGNDRVVLLGTASPGLTIEVNTGSGADTVYVRTTAGVTANLGSGNDRFYARATSSAQFNVNGGFGNDEIYSGAAGDLLIGNEGDDRIYGRNGDDELHGGGGEDRILGSIGNDYLIGGLDDDSLFGGAGNDVLDLGQGDDFGNGASGDDIVIGREGNDRLYGSHGIDAVFGGPGEDIIAVASGTNTVFGGDDYDRIFSQVGHTIVDSGAAADKVRIYSGSVEVLDDPEDSFNSFDTPTESITSAELNLLLDDIFAQLTDLDSELLLPTI